MAIYLTDKDGSDQHFDTYAEFEQAMVLMSRIGGNKVPQDLLDEVKSKYGDKEDAEEMPHTLSEDILELLSRIDEFTSGLEERRTKVRMTISDEGEDPEEEPKLEVGDIVRVVSAEDGTDSGYHGFRIGSTAEVKEVYGNGKVEAYNGIFYQKLLPHHYEKVEDSPTEFRTGDIVKVTETFEDRHGDKAHKGEVLEYDIAWPVTFVGTVVLGDNHDKLRLVCRKEDRKDIEL